MKLIAKRPCCFGGKKFYIGDEIPVEYVQNPATQEKLGVLTIVNDAPLFAAPCQEPSIELLTVPVVLHAEGEDFPLELTVEGLQSVVDVLTSKGDTAKTIVEQMTEEHALILLDATDSRKNIKEAAKARAMALNSEEVPEESEGEQ